MKLSTYLYYFSYDEPESELCKLESRHIFNKQENNKVLWSNLNIEPSCSSFIKKRLEVISYSQDYTTLINDIKKERISVEGFKVEYLVLHNDTTEYVNRLDKLRDIGYSIEGKPDYYNPTITYALCHHEGVWYFGVLIKNNLDWYKHKQKPNSYSNSISIRIAKALVNIAASADKKRRLLDACCGVGTIILEACFAGFNIEGCDINRKLCKGAIENIAHFNYTATVHRSDIKDIKNRYDAAIIDLPYNLFSSSTESDINNIIEAAAKITDRLVIVSTANITNFISSTGFKILDYCIVKKVGKKNFARKIWVCEKMN